MERRHRAISAVLVILGVLAALTNQVTCTDSSLRPDSRIVLPLGRTAYFIGERVPLAVTGDGSVRLEAVGPYGRVFLHGGEPGPLLLDTFGLAAGTYNLEVDGKETDVTLTLTSPRRRSVGSLVDEYLPPDGPSLTPAEQKDPVRAARKLREYNDELARTLRETGLSACVAMGASDMGRRSVLDTLARTGTLLLVNPDTRPTSFFPASVDPVEIEGMSQRMILTAQANSRYPNFGGFCFGWDAAGFAEDNRKRLLAYWAWGAQTQALLGYIDREQKHRDDEFTRRTGLAPVTQEEYLAYLLSIGQPDFAPVIDLPSKRWIEEAARHHKPMPAGQRAEFEKRLDAHSRYLMELYDHSYSRCTANLRATDPALRYTSSVQLDHAPVRAGQYVPSAYRSLDLRYQSAWNDHAGGPDYSYQWLFTAALLNMGKNGKPTWVCTAAGAASGRSEPPGKLVRVAAHNLAHGGSGVGFAHEAFSNVLGGLSKDVYWPRVRDRSAGEDVRSVREFLDRFAALAREGRGDHGVGILYSQSQYARQTATMSHGSTPFVALVALTRLGYTPRFVTEEELRDATPPDIRALLVLGQTVPLPAEVHASLAKFTAAGGRVFVDGSTSVEVPGAAKLGVTLPLGRPGKPHNWSAPNTPAGLNDTFLYESWHSELAPALATALSELGRGVFRSETGPATKTTLMQIDGGRDARYVVAVNDSHVGTQADWHQLRETIVPVQPGAEGVVYDCTDEKLLGKVGPLVCDLSRTTARVFAVLPRELTRIELAATQDVRGVRIVAIQVSFADAGGRRLEAVVPFHIELVQPDGKMAREFYRSTDAKGHFRMTLGMPTNAPAGEWSVKVRCQLTGRVASLPVRVRPPILWPPARPMRGKVIVREKAVIEKLLARPAKVGLPLFTPQQAELLPVARKVQEVLARRGVEVEIWPQRPAQGVPGMTIPGLDAEPRDLATYWLAYDPGPTHRDENEQVDRGELIGKLRRTTINANDWYSAAGGYRAGRPLILLDLVGRTDAGGKAASDNPMSAQLQQLGALWPEVSEAFPGKGRAVVQMVHWAFGPKSPALLIQASDVEGLTTGAAALADLPEDVFTQSVRTARTSLWSQYHVGSRPAPTGPERATSWGLRTRDAPNPFAVTFRGAEPLPPEKVSRRAAPVREAAPVPGVIRPWLYVPYARDGDTFYETSTASTLLTDLRFSDGVLLVVDVRKAGKTSVSADGVFRYSDRSPRTQAQWESVLALHRKVVPRERRAMEIEVRLGGQVIGKLAPARQGERDVPVETLPLHVAEKPRTVREEVVLELSGEIDLPAGRQELLLVPANIVDGKMRRVRVGISIEDAEALERARPRR